MHYVKTINGEVATFPYSIPKFKADNKAVSFPANISNELLASFGVYPVEYEQEPEHDPKTVYYIRANNGQPVLKNGNWVVGLERVEKTEEQISAYSNMIAESNRRIRDGLIGETDWWASSDLTMTAEQTAYRQALRDITSHANWPHLDEADWPTKP